LREQCCVPVAPAENQTADGKRRALRTADQPVNVIDAECLPRGDEKHAGIKRHHLLFTPWQVSIFMHEFHDLFGLQVTRDAEQGNPVVKHKPVTVLLKRDYLRCPDKLTQARLQ